VPTTCPASGPQPQDSELTPGAEPLTGADGLLQSDIASSPAFSGTDGLIERWAP
jgi:hypothetical protein